MKTAEIRTAAYDFEKGRDFVEDILRRSSITDEIISETMLIFEALHYNIREQNKHKDTELTITGKEVLGDVRITIGFEGNMFDPLYAAENEISPEARILSAYADKVDHTYHSGYNKITISVKRSYRRTMISCMVWILAAVAVYIPVHFIAGKQTETMLMQSVLFPLEKVFSNAILMIGAPVTFLSLIKNLTDVYILAERQSEVRQLQIKTLFTSVSSIVIAIVAVAVEELIPGIDRVRLPVSLSLPGAEQSPGDVISSLMPPSIFEPFVSVSPIPLLILAALFTYAFCSVGKYFDALKKAIDAGYVLCARVLGIIMSALPFFSFAAVMDILLSGGIKNGGKMLLLILIVLISLVFMAAFYMIRLNAAGIRVRPFVGKLRPLIMENLKINSAIDAVPYNIRYCARVFGMDRRKLERTLPVLAQINLDGNCFLLTVVTMSLITAGGVRASFMSIVFICLLILFLSLGAPNQPGTFVIGLVIILTYLHAEALLPAAICAEISLGGITNIINVTGDMVIAAEGEEELIRKQM